MANGLFNLKQVMQAVQQGGWPAQKTPAVEYLVVAGGGSGGGEVGGGGGAGGLLTGINLVPNGQTLLVTIGAGGSGTSSPGNNGSNSVFGNITATGGGKAGTYNAIPGVAGGSGGGWGGFTSGYTGISGSGVAGQGNSGGASSITYGTGGAGGGGAGTVGLTSATTSAANGGAGIASAINGTVTAYAGGGGGGSYNGSAAGTGGVGGGGNGGIAAFAVGTSGTANTGGGGGGSGAGSGWTSGTASGGSGIVIVSYPDVYAAAASTTGSPTVSTSGSGSVAFNGSSAYIRYAGQSAFAFSTGDFTIEGWFYVTSLASGIIAWDFRTASTNGAYGSLELSSNGQVRYYANSAYQISSSAGLNTVNTWAHIAVTRSGTSTKLFFNGTQVGSTYSDSTNYLVGASSPYIGSGSFPDAYLPGYISNFRVVKGTAVYTANFTPSTTPLTAISGTSLLLNSASGAYLADGSTNGFAPTATAGSPAWNAASPFTGTGYKNRVYTWTSSGSITF